MGALCDIRLVDIVNTIMSATTRAELQGASVRVESRIVTSLSIYITTVHHTLYIQTHTQLPYVLTYHPHCKNIQTKLEFATINGPANGFPHLVVPNTHHSLIKCPQATA
jgi:hypothetical protein